MDKINSKDLSTINIKLDIETIFAGKQRRFRGAYKKKQKNLENGGKPKGCSFGLFVHSESFLSVLNFSTSNFTTDLLCTKTLNILNMSYRLILRHVMDTL